MSEWVEKKLGELIHINSASLSSNHNGIIKYIDISSVDRGRLLNYTEYDFLDAPGRARRIIKNDDTIISTVRPNLRAYWYVKNCPNNAIVSTGFAVIRARENNSSRFIYYLLTENSFIDYLTLVAKGSNYPAVDTNDFKRAKVTVPDLPTQTRIGENIFRPPKNPFQPTYFWRRFCNLFSWGLEKYFSSSLSNSAKSLAKR